MAESYDVVVQAVLDKLRGESAYPASRLLGELAQEGHDPAEISFAISYLLNHGRVQLDVRQRLAAVEQPVS